MAAAGHHGRRIDSGKARRRAPRLRDRRRHVWGIRPSRAGVPSWPRPPGSRAGHVAAAARGRGGSLPITLLRLPSDDRAGSQPSPLSARVMAPTAAASSTPSLFAIARRHRTRQRRGGCGCPSRRAICPTSAGRLAPGRKSSHAGGGRGQVQEIGGENRAERGKPGRNNGGRPPPAERKNNGRVGTGGGGRGSQAGRHRRSAGAGAAPADASGAGRMRGEEPGAAGHAGLLGNAEWQPQRRHRRRMAKSSVQDPKNLVHTLTDVINDTGD